MQNPYYKFEDREEMNKAIKEALAPSFEKLMKVTTIKAGSKEEADLF